MNEFLSIDAGNSNPHAAIFLNGKIKKIFSISNIDNLDSTLSLHLKDYFTSFDFAISNVSNFDYKKYDILKNNNLINIKSRFSDQLFFNMPVYYSKEIGEDRLFQAYYIYSQFDITKCNYLLIDAGTFITYDVITNNGYQGGYIFPGFGSYRNGLNRGVQIPSSLDSKYIITKELPSTTNEALAQSISLTYLRPIEHILNQVKNVQIVLTGGTSKFLHTLMQANATKIANLNSCLLHETLIHDALFLCANKEKHHI